MLSFLILCSWWFCPPASGSSSPLFSSSTPVHVNLLEPLPLHACPLPDRLCLFHRRTELEDKAKVVAFVWGNEFVQFLAPLAVLPWSIWKKRSNSSYFSKSTEVKQQALQGIELILSLKQTQWPLPCLLIPSFFYGLFPSFLEDCYQRL